MSLVCAPAGYGKTLLLAEWAAAHPELTAWLSLDGADNDDQLFWSGVLASLASCPVVPERSALRDLAVPGRPSHDQTFLAAVVNELEAVPGPVHLVLDDVHALTAPEPRLGLGFLVRNRPAGLHLVLAGRTDPPLPLSRMRLAGELNEIRVGDLRFSVAEAAAMLAAADIDTRPEQVELLVEQTEGWAAGLRLAALSLRDAGDRDQFLTDFVGNGRAMSDYLVGEILERLPDDVLDVLRAVSVTDQLSAPLAAALSHRPDAGSVLDELERDTSLVLSSGRGRVYYRVHPLLRSHMLADLQRRDPDALLRLHARAAEWFASRGRAVQALGHAQQAEDRDRVAQILRENSVALIANGSYRVLRGALAWLGHRYVSEDPWLGFVQALADIEAGELRAADHALSLADSVWPAEPEGDLPALRDLVRARRAGVAGDAGRMVEATESRPATPDNDPRLTVMGSVDRAMALLVAARLEEAGVVAEGALAHARQLDHGYLTARVLTVQGAVAGVSGNYRRMVELAGLADAEASGADWGSMAGGALASVIRAYGALLQARPAACLDALAPAITFFDTGGPLPANPVALAVHAFRGAALADLGRVAEGLDGLRRARAAAHGQPVAALATALLALLEHGIATVAGHPEVARSALEWAEQTLDGSGDVALMRARRLAVLGRRQAAVEMLRPLLQGSLPVITPWALVEGYVLDCRLAVLEDRRPRARSSLERALALASSMEALRPLVVAPGDIAELLTRHLGSFGDLDRTARQVLELRHALDADHRPVALTERERAVLRLLPTPRSFDEIAADLTVSHSTVKTHVRAIYGKLGVNTRRDAVDQARLFGLFLREASAASSS